MPVCVWYTVIVMCLACVDITCVMRTRERKTTYVLCATSYVFKLYYLEPLCSSLTLAVAVRGSCSAVIDERPTEGLGFTGVGASSWAFVTSSLLEKPVRTAHHL